MAARFVQRSLRSMLGFGLPCLGFLVFLLEQPIDRFLRIGEAAEDGKKSLTQVSVAGGSPSVSGVPVEF